MTKSTTRTVISTAPVILASAEVEPGVTLEVVEMFKSLPGLVREPNGARLRRVEAGEPAWVGPRRDTFEEAQADMLALIAPVAEKPLPKPRKPRTKRQQ